MRTRINLTFFIVFLAALFICASTQAQMSWQVTSIGTGSNPQIYGKKIVWQDTDGEIYLYDAQEEYPLPVLISDDSYGNSNPQIYGDYICWVGVDDYDDIFKVFLHDGMQCITLDGGTDPNVSQLSDKLVVWDAYDGDNHEIYAYDIAAMSTSKLTNDGYDNWNAQVSGDHVTWEAHDSPYYISLFFYDAFDDRMVKVREVEGVDNWHPQIYDDTIAWWGGFIYPDPNWYKLELFMFDEGDDYEPVKITEDYAHAVQVYPQIWGKNIVWEGLDESWIDFYDGITEERTHIPNQCRWNKHPQLWDNKVVWEGINESYNYEIYFWDGDTNTTYNLSESAAEDHAPQIYESDVVWHTDANVVYFAEADVFEPDIDVSPLTYDFGPILVGQSAATTITITNVGNNDLTIDSIDLLQKGPASYSIESTLPAMPFVLASDEFIEVEIEFSPLKDESASAVLEIVSDDPDEDIVQVSLSGAGYVLYIPDINVSPLTYDFGDVQSGESATTTLTISNLGNVLLILSDIEFTPESSGDFSIVPETEPTLPLVLRIHGPKASIDIEIEFNPLDIGPKSAVLEIYSDDWDENPVIVNFIGTGI